MTPWSGCEHGESSALMILMMMLIYGHAGHGSSADKTIVASMVMATEMATDAALMTRR